MSAPHASSTVGQDDLLHGHLARCERDAGRWFPLRCMAESVHGFLAPRFVTTLALALTVMASVAMAA